MNLFILSQDPQECAQYMMDTHIVKIILEAVQMLSTAKRLLDAFGTEYDEIVTKKEAREKTKEKRELTKEKEKETKEKEKEEKEAAKALQKYKQDARKIANQLDLPVYKCAHVAHPVSIWVRETRENYFWTLDLVDAMHTEWRYRYDHNTTTFHKSYLVAQYLRQHPPAPFIQKPAELCIQQNQTHKQKSQTTINNTPCSDSQDSLQEDCITVFAIAMPDECKVGGKNGKYTYTDAVESYRNYYRSDAKRRLATWRKRQPPEWW